MMASIQPEVEQGWMHDLVEYMKLDPYFRKGDGMTFALTYAYKENHIFVLSHDEVVHLKCSMLNKMPGLDLRNLPTLKVGYAFMMGHPGKKLLHGTGLDSLSGARRELDWYLLVKAGASGTLRISNDLSCIYTHNKAKPYEQDIVIKALNGLRCSRSIYSFIRHSKAQKEPLSACNFTFDRMTGVACRCTGAANSTAWYRTVMNCSMAEAESPSYMKQRNRNGWKTIWLRSAIRCQGIRILT